MSSKKNTILVMDRSDAIKTAISRVNFGPKINLAFADPDSAAEIEENGYLAVFADDYLMHGAGPEPPMILLRRKLNCPIILMTASGSPRVVQVAKQAGADGVLQKPFGAGELRRELSRVLQATGSDSGAVLDGERTSQPASQEPTGSVDVPEFQGRIASETTFDELFQELQRRQPLEEGLDAFDVVERHLIRRALEATSGNQSQSARFLGITRNTLRKRIRKYGFSGMLTKDDENAE